MAHSSSTPVRNIDYALFFLVLGIVIFGVMMISSVSVYQSFKTTVSSWDPNNLFFLKRNLMHVTLGFIGLWALTRVHITTFERNARYFYLGAVGLLVIALLFGVRYNGAKGWLNIPFLPTLQPVEFAKLALILYLAYFLKHRKSLLASFSDGFLPYFTIVGVPLILLGLQPDFGSILVIAPITALLFFLWGWNARYLLTSLAVAFVAAFWVYLAGSYDTPEDRTSLSYIHDRINNFLSDNRTAIDNKTINFQTEQGLIAIGSGGFWWRGFGKSLQKFGYLPEVQGDFIFSVIVEELGFLGAALLVVFYGAIVQRAFYISRHSPDLFGRYASAGIGIWIAMQAYINLGVNLNIVPLTGVTLPFVSYGGSSLLSLMMGIGVLLSLSRHIHEPVLKTPRNTHKDFKREQIMLHP